MITFSELSEAERESLRRYSKALYGNADALEVELAVAQREDAFVNATDLHWELRLATNRVRAQLERLRQLGLVSAPTSRGDRKRWYVRRQSAHWDAVFWHYMNALDGQLEATAAVGVAGGG
jgi:hypothetical protein